MITKTLVAVTLIAGFASTSAIAAPKHRSSSAAERNATKQLNEQQLASAGNIGSMRGMPAASPTAPDQAMTPAPMTQDQAMTPPAAPMTPDAPPESVAPTVPPR